MRILTARTDPTTFLHILQEMGLTGDWLPFQQSKWIAEVLHGGIPKPSRFAAGICNEMCAWMMVKWVKDGPNSRYIVELDNHINAEMIVGMADARADAPPHVKSDYEYFAYLMAGKKIASSHAALLYNSSRQAFEAVKNLGNCAVCMHPSGAGAGHTIICSGLYRSVFDPNIGYVRAKSATDLEHILNTIVNTRYPEFKSGIIGIITCK